MSVSESPTGEPGVDVLPTAMQNVELAHETEANSLLASVPFGTVLMAQDAPFQYSPSVWVADVIGFST